MKLIDCRNLFPTLALVIGISSLASPALAMVPVPGAFVASECGEVVSNAAEQQRSPLLAVCVGHIAPPSSQANDGNATAQAGEMSGIGAGGAAGSVGGALGQAQELRAVQFRLLDGRVETFRVMGEMHLWIALSDGQTAAIYQLQAADGSADAPAMRATMSADGSVVAMAGVFGGAPFSVPQPHRIVVLF
jgi:hypothetical protein